MTNWITGHTAPWSEIVAAMEASGLHIIYGHLYKTGNGSLSSWPEESLTEDDELAIEEGLADLRAGRVVTDEEMRAMVYG